MSTPPPAAAMPSAAFLAEAAYWIRGTQMSFAAWYAILLWEWLINLPREWRLIWKSQWSVVKVLYLLSRYWVLLDGVFLLWAFTGYHTLETCHKIGRAPEFLTMGNQMWSEGILIVRVYAFWGNKLPLLVTLCTALLCLSVYQGWIVAERMTLLPFISPPTGPCFPQVTFPGSTFIMQYFILPLAFDACLTVLTIVRALQLRKQTVGGAGSPLLKTFVREGVLYFIVISASNLVNGIFYWQPNATMSGLNIPFSVQFPNILACRLILDLREKGKAGTTGSHHQASYSHSHRRIGPKMPTTNGTTGPRRTDDVVSQGAITAMDFNHELESFDGRNNNGRRVTVVTPKAGRNKDLISDLDVKNDYDFTSSNGVVAAQGIRVDIESHHYYEPSDEEKSEKGRSFMP